MSLEWIVCVKQKCIICFARTDVNDAPATELERLQHIDNRIMQLFGDCGCQRYPAFGREAAVHAVARGCRTHGGRRNDKGSDQNIVHDRHAGFAIVYHCTDTTWLYRTMNCLPDQNSDLAGVTHSIHLCLDQPCRDTILRALRTSPRRRLPALPPRD